MINHGSIKPIVFEYRIWTREGNTELINATSCTVTEGYIVLELDGLLIASFFQPMSVINLGPYENYDFTTRMDKDDFNEKA